MDVDEAYRVRGKVALEFISVYDLHGEHVAALILNPATTDDAIT